MENMTIKEIQNKLLLWEAAENPLAPLTATQREAILDLEASLQSSDDDIEEEPQKHDTITDIPHVNTTYDFLDWYETLSEQNMKTNDIPYEEYYKQLADRRDECNSLTDQIAATLSDLNTLSDQYNLVSNKTTALHTMSEQLLADQNKLSNIVDHLSQRLNSHTISVNSDTFFNVISKIDECLEYMRAHSRGMALIRSYVNHILNIATEQVLTPDDPSDTDSMDTAYAVYFGKFQAAAPKLKMVISEIEKRAEQIALSLQEQSLKRCDSRNSLASEVSTTSQEVANINVEAQRRPQASPADLHGMWYPGVRRTLAALSRLYRCLEKRVFQGLAQEAISLCVQSVSNAANQISATKTNIDGQLFEIKHLLIVREQIAPFQVDFVIKETSLDFSNMKNAAYGLIQKPRQIFSLNSNNALLEFLLEGTPMVREHLLDSRKEVDRQLKSCCEQFIKDATEILVGPIKEFIDKPWATPSQIAIAVHEAQRRIKLHLATLQRSMQLYLANKETEFILFRPIRNNVVGLFMQLEQYLTNNGYTHDDILIVACPTPEQISVFISSASLISHSETVLPYGKKRPISAIRKPSVTSIPEKKGETTVETIQSQAT
ncbi:unnamed protein product [Leptidea sinapis]|uniref:Conserved oligomeric Golgi complex subunit 3 n=1 Tax=Leptidea sinapis TaxID=189913 RepID=A0A5E4PYQ7_9NEOP|nr:unnamed protein product [Leptidea sinapis]